MNAEERAHVEQLLEINRAHLRELETQQAKLGILAPSGVAVQIAEYRQKIAELEEQLSKALPRHNLPPRDYEQFIGRQKELAELRRLLQPYPKSRAYVITIDGIGGIGKSALALETAYTFRDQYATLPESERFEAIVWVSAKRSYLTADGILERRQAFRTLDDLYAAIAQVLDYPAITRAKVEEQRAIVEDVLREQRTLLILDNLETVDDEELLSFLHELPDPTKALVTTRHRIDVARPVRLTGMSHEDALMLIEQECARKSVVLRLEEREDLWHRTGGVPLAIVWSIGLMGLGGSAESVLRRLGSGQSDIARFCFEESVAHIRGQDAHKLLMGLSLFASDAGREALGVVAGLGQDEFGRDVGLEELLRLSLVNKEGDRFGLLPLTRSFVQNEAAAYEDWMKQARELWENYYSDLVGGWTSDRLVDERVEAELTNLLKVAASLEARLHYLKAEDSSKVLDPASIPVATKLLSFLARLIRSCRNRGYWSDAERLCYVEINVARAKNDADYSGWGAYILGRINYRRGLLDAAKNWSMESIRSWETDETGRRTYYAFRLIGLIELSHGNIDQASEYLIRAINDYKQFSKSQNSLQNFLESLGELAEKKGDKEGSISWYQQAIEASRRNNDLEHLSYSLLNLSRVMLGLGDIEQAKVLCTEGLLKAEESGIAAVLAKAHYHMAYFESIQQISLVSSHARQALDLFRRLGMKREQAEAEALLARLSATDESSGGEESIQE